MKKNGISSKFKARVALDALKDQEPLSKIASRHKVHGIQVGKWRKTLLTNAHLVFEDDSGNGQSELERENAELYEQIGRLKVENDFLKKKSGLS
jgi:putative transposase